MGFMLPDFVVCNRLLSKLVNIYLPTYLLTVSYLLLTYLFLA